MDHTWLVIVSGLLAGAASAPHCFAMCGPLALFSVAGGARGSAPARIARYQLGRLGAYAVVGAIAGVSGGALTAWLAPRPTAIALALVVAAAMIFAAIRLVRTSPGKPLVTLRTQRSRPPLSARIFAYVPREPLWIGAFSALLPCGALYTAVLLAVGAGAWTSGALVMIAFAITSGLGLLASAAIGERARTSKLGRRILAAVLIAGALVVVLRPVLSEDGAAACHGAHQEPAYGCGARR
jgi:sulfite exporter TauE/SafE